MFTSARRRAIPRIACLILIISVVPGAWPQENAQSSGEAFTRHIETLTAAVPRPEGSAGEAATLDYIRKELTAAEVSFSVESLAGIERGHSFSTSIHAEIPGSGTEELLFVAPINHPDDAAAGSAGSVNIALGLLLAAHFAQQTPPATVRILFLGAEYGDGEYYPIGSRQFVDSFYPDDSVVVFYSLFQFPPDRIIIRSGDRGYVSPYWLTESCSRSLDEADLFYLVRGNENQFYRLGMATNPAPLEPYLADSYPALSFHGTQRRIADYEMEPWANRFIDFVDAFLQTHSSGFPTQWDRHYLFFQARSFSMILAEDTYIIIVISIVSIMILYPLVFPHRFRNYIRSIARNFWALPVLLVLSFFMLFLGTLIIEGAFALKRFPTAWRYRPFLFFALKLSATVFLFTLLFRYVKRIPFPRRGRFYNAAALVVLVLDIIILAVINVSLSYYVVWAAIWAFLFSLAPSRRLKTLCWLASPVWFVKAIYDVFTLPELNIAEEMLLSRFSGNLIIAFILLPFLLMLIRLDFMYRHPRIRTKKILMPMVFSVVGLTFAGLLVYLIVYWPFSPERPQPIVAAELVDLTNDQADLIIASPGPLGVISIERNGTEETYTTGANRIAFSADPDPALLRIQGGSTRFLGRKRISISMTSIGTPVKIEVGLTAPEELVLYDASFPYSYREINAVTIHIGRNPPIPFQLQFTVPVDQTGTVDIRATFAEPPGDLAVSGTNITVDRTMTVSRVLRIRDLE